MKKKFLVFSTVLVLSQMAIAQNIGIGNTNPQAKLDVSGDLILRSYSLTVADGTTYALDVNTNKFSNYKLTGTTGNFQIAGITAAANDRNITLYNRTGNSMEIYNDDVNAPASNRILTGTGTTFAVYNGGTVSLRYDTAIQKWEVISSHYNNLDYFGAGTGNWDLNGTAIFNTNTGNVGVGTNTPDAKLTVNGNIALLSDTVKIGCGIFPSNLIIDNIAKPKSVFHIINDGCGSFMPPNIIGLSGGTDGKIVTLITHLNNTALRHLQGNSGSPTAQDSMNMIELYEPNTNGNLNQPSSYSFNAGGSVTLIYDGIRNRWKLLSYNGDVKTVQPLPYATQETSLISGYNFSTGTEAVLPAVKTLAGNTQIMGIADDSYSANLTLPFALVLAGTTYTNFAVSANGLMQLLTASNITPNLNASLNSINSNAYNAKLAPLWDDLNLTNDLSNPGGIWSITTGNAPNRQFHIEWIGTYFNQGGVNNLRFRIILNETSNEIKFHYCQTVNSNIPGGGGFTIGVTPDGIDFSNIYTPNNTATSAVAYDSNYTAPVAGRYYLWTPALTSTTYLPVNGNINMSGFIETETETAPVLLNGWTNYGNGFKTAGYYKDKQRIVHLSGMLNNNTPANTVLFNLPLPYRPAGGSLIVTVPNNLTNFTSVTINSNGNITCSGNAVSGFISLDGISFRSN